jgi:hypothetical protein
MGIRQTGEPRESVASGNGVCGGFAFARPRRSSEAVLSSFRHGRASLRSLLAHMPFPKTAFRTFRGYALPLCLHGGPKPTPRPGEGGSPARRRASPLRRSKPLSPLPHVTADNESASSRPHRHVTRSVRRRKDVQDRRCAEGGDDLRVKRAAGTGRIGFFRCRCPRISLLCVTVPASLGMTEERLRKLKGWGGVRAGAVPHTALGKAVRIQSRKALILRMLRRFSG